jgi:hypothetical protein
MKSPSHLSTSLHKLIRHFLTYEANDWLKTPTSPEKWWAASDLLQFTQCCFIWVVLEGEWFIVLLTKLNKSIEVQSVSLSLAPFVFLSSLSKPFFHTTTTVGHQKNFHNSKVCVLALLLHHQE